MGLRIAILAHSTNPRGGVVHALELAEALSELGHHAVVHAPDASGKGFFRTATCGLRAIPVAPPAPGIRAMIEQRIGDYVRYFETPANRVFDIYHAQDGISANALATLRERGLISGFARTIHHLDTFDDPEIMRMQERAVIAASQHFVVSRHWQAQLGAQYGIRASIVGNGVRSERFQNRDTACEAALARRFGLNGRPIILSVGGVEERKNTLNILQAFALLRANWPEAQLVIAGGASLLDHGGYQRRFLEAKQALGLPDDAVITTGPLPDADMPALFRLADVLAFPSLKEGFGLVVLEAMASGLPVVTSRRPPFTEYLKPDDAAWCDPEDAVSIAEALCMALEPVAGKKLAALGPRIAARHTWRKVAEAHVQAYAKLMEAAYA
jgi:glycosyltransferase-like protein